MKLNMDLDIGEAISASDWVKQNRVKSKEEKELDKMRREALLKQKQLDEEEEELVEQIKPMIYSSKNLTGLKVSHVNKSFEIGQEVVLTLADTNILQHDDYGNVVGVAEDDDVLENVNLADVDRRIDREKKLKRLRQPVYSALDDDEFQEKNDDGINLPGMKGSILSQYDYDKKKKSGPVMEIGEDGVIIDHSIKNNNNNNNRVENKIIDNLATETKQMSDYYTPAEFSKFKSKSKDKKKRKIRKTIDDDNNNEEIQNNFDNNNDSNGLDSLIPMDIEVNEDIAYDTVDRSNRLAVTNSKSELTLLEEEEMKRKENYERAVQKAQERTAKAFNSTSIDVSTDISTDNVNKKKKPMIKPLIANEVILPKVSVSSLKSINLDEEDHDLTVALAKARRVALMNRKKEEEEDDNNRDNRHDGDLRDLRDNRDDDYAAKAIAEQVKQQQIKSVNESKISEEGINESDDVNVEGRRADGRLVFNSTTEFTARLQANLTEKARYRAEALLRDEEVNVNLPGRFVHRQPLVATGMAATLALLKSTGELKKSDTLIGRAKDTRGIDPSSEEFGVNIDYRDKNGMKLTQKQAFRELSYKFHGFGPGKKNKEKRTKATQIRLQAESARGLSGGYTNTMKSLTQAQEATGKAHITIQAGGSMSSSNLASLMAKK
eukprot:gene5488-7599_t